MKDYPFIFVDVETTGLTPGYNEIIELCMCKTDINFSSQQWYHAKVYPSKLERISKEAAEVNGFDKDNWNPCVPIDDVLKTFSDFTQSKYILVGHNVFFDWSFIRSEYKTYIGDINNPRYFLDTMALAYPLLLSGKIERLGLEHLCNYFGVSNERKHRADADVKRLIEVFQKLTSLYITNDKLAEAWFYRGDLAQHAEKAIEQLQSNFTSENLFYARNILTRLESEKFHSITHRLAAAIVEAGIKFALKKDNIHG